MTQSFDFNKALAELQSGKGLTGEDGVLTLLIKQLNEAALKVELEQHLESDPEPNRKNGASNKTVKSSVGQFELETLRDRSGSFEHQFVKKNQTELTAEIDKKILSMFALDMSYRDIRSHVQLIPEVKAWQSRNLDTRCIRSSGSIPFIMKSRKVAFMLVRLFTPYLALILKAVRNYLACICQKKKRLTTGS